MGDGKKDPTQAAPPASMGGSTGGSSERRKPVRVAATSSRLASFVASTTSTAWARPTPHKRDHPIQAARADHLVIATANIQFQEREDRLLELVQALRQSEHTTPAILALQEVQGVDDGDGHTIYQLAQMFQMSMRYQGARRHPLVRSAPAPGSFGNAILSNAGFVEGSCGGRVELRHGGWEPRVALDVRVPLDDGSAVRVLATHLDHGGVFGVVVNNGPGRAQLEHLVDLAEASDEPTVIVGDFNLTPDVVAGVIKGSRFIDPARGRKAHGVGTAGSRRIDYVLVDSDAFDVEDCDLIRLYDRGEGRNNISDHHAVVAILRRRRSG